MAKMLTAPDAVITAIQERHSANLSLASSEVQKTDPDLYWSACKAFGRRAWRNALIRAGFDYDSVMVRPRKNKALLVVKHPLVMPRGFILPQKAQERKGKTKPHLFMPGSVAITPTAAQESKFLIDQLPQASKEPSPVEKRKPEFTVREFPEGPAWFQFQDSGKTGLSWWRLLNPEAKLAAIRPLVEAGMSFAAISNRLKLESRNRVIGVWDRFTNQNRVRPPGTRVGRIAQPRRVMWSLDAPAYRDSNTTWHEINGAEDPSFARFESQQLLQTLLDKRKLADNVAALLKRLILGDDLGDEEYRQLASAIREHADLMNIVEHL